MKITFLENAKMGLTSAKMCVIMIGESGYSGATLYQHNCILCPRKPFGVLVVAHAKTLNGFSF